MELEVSNIKHLAEEQLLNTFLLSEAQLSHQSSSKVQNLKNSVMLGLLRHRRRK